MKDFEKVSLLVRDAAAVPLEYFEVISGLVSRVVRHWKGGFWRGLSS